MTPSSTPDACDQAFAASGPALLEAEIENGGPVGPAWWARHFWELSRQQAFLDLAAWLGKDDPDVAGHIICNVNDPGNPGDGSCKRLDEETER